MMTRPIRFHDLPAIHRLSVDPLSYVVEPPDFESPHSVLHLAVASAWQDVNQSVFTFVSRDKGNLVGLAQATARPGNDAWDLVRLLRRQGDDGAAQGVDEMLEGILAATASRGGLRTFVRVSVDGDGQELLTRQGFRQYTNEYTLWRDGLDLTPTPAPERLEFRPRRLADAWGIFQLYCAVAPPMVRHAEGLSSKRWGGGSRPAALLAGLRRTREVVLVDEGVLVGWARLIPRQGNSPSSVQRLAMMMHPQAVDALPALLAHAAIVLEARLDCPTVCTVRAYEETVYNSLIDVGFVPTFEHALLVKHSVARVVERQFLAAALRTQSRGLEISRSHQPSRPVMAAPLIAGSQRQPYHTTPIGLEHPLHVRRDD